MNIKKWLGLIAVLLLLFFIISAPLEAAGAGHSILDSLKLGAEAVIRFFKALVH